MQQQDDSTDYALALERCAAGDGHGLESIYRAEASRLIGVAMRIVRHREQAEDVVHDAFIHIWAKASGFDRNRGSSGRGSTAWCATARSTRSAASAKATSATTNSSTSPMAAMAR